MNRVVLSPRASLWTLRALAVALAPLMGAAIGAATAGRSSIAGVVAMAAWAAAVAAVVIDLVVPSPLALTVVRLILPATVPAASIALAFGADTVPGICAVTVALLATLVAYSAETAEALVQGSAYGEERRLPLRVPAALLLPMALSWTLWCSAVIGAMLLACAARWALATVVMAVAVALSVLLGRRFHRFSRRWLVVVPAGVVLHDQFVLAETAMLQRANITVARLAPIDTSACDLTGPAAGHAVEIILEEMELVVLAPTPAEPRGTALHVQSLLVAPSRAGRALQAMAAAKVPVG